MSGVFGLRKIYKRQVENKTEGINLSTPGLNYGYLGGGFPAIAGPVPGHTWLSTLERIDFNTETLTSSLRLINERDGRGGTASDSYGYFAGGSWFGERSSFIERLDFSSETVVSPPTLNLAESRWILFAESSNNYGYFAGGYNPTTSLCTINRLEFSTETRTTLSSTLPTDRGNEEGSVKNNSYAYFGGGYIPGTSTCTIDRLDFSIETVSRNLTLPKTRGGHGGVFSSLYGYFGGGYDPVANVCTIDRLNFSTETFSTLSSQLSETKSSIAGLSSKTYGYFCGGGPPTPLAVTSTIDRLDFNTDTISVPSSKLVFGRFSMATVNINRQGVTKISPRFTNWTESATTGYYGGGYFTTSPGADYAEKSFINRLDFSSETISQSSSLKRIIKDAYHSSTQNSLYGYFQQAYDIYLERLDFSSETNIEIPTKIGNSTYTSDKTALSSPNYGYFGSGYMGRPASLPGALSTIHRLDFTTESITLLPERLKLGHGQGQYATDNDSGYFINGYYLDTPAVSPIRQNTSSIERIDFSNETTNIIGFSIFAVAAGGSIGNSSDFYSYFGGGYDYFGGAYISSIYRFDLSTTVTSRVPSNLSQSRYFTSGTQSNVYGYFAGGITPPYNSVSTIDRFDLSTNTVSSPTAKLTQSIATFGGISGGTGTRRVGKATYGYFAGGYFYTSIIDRLDFTTETIGQPSVTPKLSQAKIGAASISNNYYGYFAGGWLTPPGYTCTIDRLDFSSETTNISPAKISRAYNCGTSSSSYGYFGGNYGPAPTSTIIRFDFITETTATPSSKLSQEKWYLSSVSNNLYGYYGGGTSYPIYYSTIDRIDFSTDTITTPTTTLSQSKSQPISVYNHSYGYFGGGYIYVPTVTVYCTIDRLDFSTETRATPGTYQLTQARGVTMGVSSSSYGYFGGGYIGPGNVSSKIDRLDFAAETISVPSQKLTGTKYMIATVSNSQ